MVDKCKDWIAKCALLADEYYRAMAAWAASRRSKETLEDVIKLGTAFEIALDGTLACLRGIRRSELANRQIARAQGDKDLISAQLKSLIVRKKGSPWRSHRHLMTRRPVAKTSGSKAKTA